MSFTFLGTKSVGAACIGVALAVPTLAGSLGDLLSRIAALEAQVAANAAMLLSLPNPAEIAASIQSAALAAVAAISDIVTSIPGPLISANASLEKDLAVLVGLKASIESVVGTLSGAISAGGVHCFAIDSTPASLGGEVSAAIAGGISGGLPGARIRGVMLVTEDPASFAALSAVVATS